VDEAGKAMAKEMLGATPLGLRKTKETLALAQKLNDLDAIIELEEHTQLACIQDGDFEEALKAFVEKRPPKFAV
jgi:enoyl-CoA hydratase/carnithine racemase